MENLKEIFATGKRLKWSGLGAHTEAVLRQFVGLQQSGRDKLPQADDRLQSADST